MLLIGEAFVTDDEAPTDPIQRIVASTTMTERLLLHAATGIVDRFVREPDRVEVIDHDRRVEPVSQPGRVPAERIDDRHLDSRNPFGLARVGAVLVGGHSEVTDAVRTPVVAGTMLGIAPGGQFVTTSGARPDDIVVQVGAVPVEGAAVLATEARLRLASVDETFLDAASRALDEPGISIVDAALLATALGASAMHDPTEGGRASGLHELAVASGCSVRVDRRRVQWFQPGRVVCAALGADPWATLASGCLLATFPQPVADAAAVCLAERFDTTVLGRVETGRGVYDETGSEIAWPERDEVARILEQ